MSVTTHHSRDIVFGCNGRQTVWTSTSHGTKHSPIRKVAALNDNVKCHFRVCDGPYPTWSYNSVTTVPHNLVRPKAMQCLFEHTSYNPRRDIHLMEKGTQWIERSILSLASSRRRDLLPPPEGGAGEQEREPEGWFPTYHMPG